MVHRKLRRVCMDGQGTSSRMLSDEQADGRECICCTLSDGPMVPAGWCNGVQIFAHADCITGSAA